MTISAGPLSSLARLLTGKAAPATRSEAQSLAFTFTDSIAVAIAGSMTQEHHALLASWPLPVGQSSLFGTSSRTDPHTAAILNGTAMCSLELDSGNRLARGHPAAHVVPAVLAEAQRIGCSGDELFRGIVVGCEASTRLARAFRPRPGLHPHGHWGAIGAAAGVATLHGLSADGIAAAMDTAAALAIAGPFSVATKGSFVRNLWVGLAAAHGITAVRLVNAGLASDAGIVHDTFGSLLGTLDVDEVTRGPEDPWTIEQTYFKHHSSCAYTHAAADAALELREKLGQSTRDIRSVMVDTYSLATNLDSTTPTTRLAGMFSIPHVTAVALTRGIVSPTGFDEAHLFDSEISRLRGVTTIAVDQVIDSRVPAQRGARVTVERVDGSRLVAEVANARGDYDFHPFDAVQLRSKLGSLLGDNRASSLQKSIDRLSTSPNVQDTLGELFHSPSNLDEPQGAQ